MFYAILPNGDIAWNLFAARDAVFPDLMGRRAVPEEAGHMKNLFRKFANGTSTAVGSPWAFILAATTIVVWAITGPVFHFSDTWQLVINTGTTIVTFLMVFLIQNTQNRDAKAIHLKLDELIRAQRDARNGLVDLENLTDEEIARLEEQFKRVQARAQNPISSRTVEALEEGLEDRDEGQRQERHIKRA
jgi:low affinity Fe/Cu permease